MLLPLLWCCSHLPCAYLAGMAGTAGMPMSVTIEVEVLNGENERVKECRVCPAVLCQAPLYCYGSTLLRQVGLLYGCLSKGDDTFLKIENAIHTPNPRRICQCAFKLARSITTGHSPSPQGFFANNPSGLRERETAAEKA